MRLGVIPGIALQHLESLTGPTPFATNCGNRIHQRKELRYIVPVRFRDRGRKGYPRSVHDEVVFGAFFRPVGRVRPRFGPPRTARTEELSMMALEKSILSAPRRRARSTSWIFCHTPCCCQARRYRQQLIPQPQPISWGRYSQGMPVFSTYRMPISALRRSMGLRPGFRRLRGLGGGRSGSISDQRPSGTRSSTFILLSQLRAMKKISTPARVFKPLC